MSVFASIGTAVNVSGYVVVSVAKSEGQLDESIYNDPEAGNQLELHTEHKV
ncbi:hypothetical protein MUS1_01420 [Marinomonas ushuaiensis DSM 15871]|uniref:Uncharacterized protein n=1 Tax=Marinomonas ushuaiensis DSM 15871 TaxID=1122207 RepID=X7E997_9GAMM|nr:hypothetical protein [Marinomonas ushuaiensis]ETX12674.1 hypothetical protein MUS1_01420 [Marinomonas ushuaiensis DSM 15871]